MVEYGATFWESPVCRAGLAAASHAAIGMLPIQAWRVSGGSRLLAAMAAIALLVLPSPSSAQDADLNAIAQSLRQWRSSFVTVRLVWETWDPQLLQEKGALRPSPNDRFNREQWIWSDVGGTRQDDWMYYRGQVVGRSSWGLDGRKLLLFRAEYGAKGANFEFLGKLLLNRMSSPKPKSSHGVAPLITLYQPAEDLWLGDSLAIDKAHLEKYDEVDGVRYARLQIKKATVWLDPNHGYLVKRVVAPQNGSPVQWFAVEEYLRVGQLWFPERGVHHDAHWLVTDVAVNEPLAANVFDPPAPVKGTLVTDGIKHIAYTYGSSQSEEGRERAMAETAKKGMNDVPAPVSAVVPRSPWMSLSFALLLVSAAFLLTGLVILWKRRS